MTETDKARERFTNQKRFIATEKDTVTKWGLDGKGFFCGMCGHRFKAGEGVRWIYANGSTPSAGNFFTCDACDGPDVLQRRMAACELAKSVDSNEFVLAAELIKARAYGAAKYEAGAAQMRERAANMCAGALVPEIFHKASMYTEFERGGDNYLAMLAGAVRALPLREKD